MLHLVYVMFCATSAFRLFPRRPSHDMGLNIFGLAILPGILSFQQNDFKLIYERVEVVTFNTSYLGFVNTHNSKFNRTHFATVLTTEIKLNFDYEIKTEVQAYRRASNEYREFPMRFMFDFCAYVARNEFGLGDFWNCGNSTACPFKKGISRSCVWAPKAERFPPNIPSGSYKLDLKFFYRSVDFLLLQGYATVKYPECRTCFF